MRIRSLGLSCLAASALALLALSPPAAAAGAVVPVSGEDDPSLLDVRVVIASSPKGTTRWSNVTIPDSTHVLWLVPARPGATIDWGTDGWLPALEDATSPRIVRPSFASTCTVSTNVERATSWTSAAAKRQPASFSVHPSAASVRDAATTRGFSISAALDARIDALYADGWQLVALEIESTVGTASSGTLRITDDGAPALPLALVGSRVVDARVTAFAIGAGVAHTGGTREVDGSALRWGASGSNFLAWRRDLLAAGSGKLWLRESASHAALFEGALVSGGAPTPSVVSAYLGPTTCAASAADAGTSDAVVGESIPAATFACSGLDDLAIALDGLAPRDAVVTRYTGIVPRGDLATDHALTFDAAAFQSLPVVRAGAYETCPGGSTSTPDRPLAPGGTGGTDGTDGTIVGTGGTDVVYVGDGCGGGTTTTTTYDEEETTSTSSEDDCGGDTSTTSSSDDEGWDTSDDSGDSCGSDSESSSSSSDSCSGGSSSSSSGGSDDGWDTEDEMTPKAQKHSLRDRPKRSRSPVSRFALFAFALILPLRRRARAALRL